MKKSACVLVLAIFWGLVTVTTQSTENVMQQIEQTLRWIAIWGFCITVILMEK